MRLPASFYEVKALLTRSPEDRRFASRELRHLVNELPADERSSLSRGPVDRDCRVCQALNRSRATQAYELIKYHLGLDIYPHLRTDLTGHTRLCAQRCLKIYRAAGWKPQNRCLIGSQDFASQTHR